MSEHNSHPPLPLEELFVLLETNNFRMDPARRFRMLKVLYSRGWSELGDDGFQTLKYRLAPFVVTSAEEQERFYAIFDDWLKKNREAAQHLFAQKEEEPESTAKQPEPKPPNRILKALLSIVLLAGAVWLGFYFFAPTPPAPRISERTTRVAAAEAVSFSTTLQWRQDSTQLRWELSSSAAVTVATGLTRFSFVTPSTVGDTLQLSLWYEGEEVDHLSMPVFCAVPPVIAEVSWPENIAANEAFELAVSLDSGQLAQWTIGSGKDTVLIGDRVTYLPTANEDLSVRLRVYEQGFYDFCFSETQQVLRAKTAEKPYMARADIRRDTPVVSMAIRGWFWWLPVTMTLVALLLWRNWRQTRNRYRAVGLREEPEFKINDNAPYFIPYQPHDELIKVPREFYQMVEVLRRREMGTTRSFDLGASLRETLDNGGYPVFREKWNTRPGSWLFLIERKTPREQLGRLFGRLAAFLVAENAPVDIYIHDGSFASFLPYKGGATSKALSLHELHQQYPTHRLVVLGSGRGMINTYYGVIAPAVRKGLERWDKRLLLTGLPLGDWSAEESLLHDLFVLYPADTAGCLAGFEALDSQEDAYEPGDFKAWRALLLRERTYESLTDFYFDTPRDYLIYFKDHSLYRWFCGLSVCVAPDWSLTLAIGEALGAEISHDNLLKLARIPWLNENTPDPDLRLQMLQELSPSDVKKAREVLLKELEAVKEVVKGGFAEVDRRSQEAVQHFALDPRDKEHMKVLADLLRVGWISGGQEQELEEVIWKNADKKGLKPEAIESLRAYLDTPDEKPLFAERLIPAVLAALMAVGLLIHGVWNRPAWDGAPWWTIRDNKDEAFVVHHQALDLLDSLLLVPKANLFAPDDSLLRSGIDSLFSLAVQLRRPDYYAAADSNLQAFRFNQGVDALHAIIDGDSLVNALDAVALAWFDRVGDSPSPQLRLDALHGRGLTYFYQPDTARAWAVYDSLGDAYFDALSLTQPIHLAYLLNAIRDTGTTSDPLEQEAWEAALASNSVYGFLTFMDKYPESQYRPEALQRLSVIKRRTLAALPSNMVSVKGGSFTMGCTGEQGGDCDDDEKPAHKAFVGDFSIGKYEVTHADWFAVMNDYPANFKDCDRCAVESVSWDEVQTFLVKLNALTGKSYRLPTEAEWEYAARGGINSRGYKYAGSNNLNEVGWYDDNSRFTTHEVGGKRSNELGLYDMSGNVSEWVNDRYGTYPDKNANSSNRVIRGGAWDAPAAQSRVSYRDRLQPSEALYSAGLRLALGSNDPEGLAWEEAIRLNTIADYNIYLTSYSNGKYAGEARRRIAELEEEEAWVLAKGKNTIQDYSNYVKRYPNGKYAEEARRLITELEEEEAWRLAKSTNTVAAYQSYLQQYPNGKYAAEAKEAINPPVPEAIAAIAGNMVRVSGGTFTMGCTSEQGGECYDDESPAHQVTLSSYEMGKYEVTQAEWRAVMGSDPEELAFKGCDACPVERVSWNDIQEFLRKLNGMTNGGYRLPTEAEWEYAARGGSSSRGYKYAGGNDLGRVAWYGDNSGSKTHPVGQKQANELGLYDMSGNVWEWCSDWYGDYASGAQTNPKGPGKGSYRVNRGGSWGNDAQYCRVSHRYGPAGRNYLIGFRLARSSNQ